MALPIVSNPQDIQTVETLRTNVDPSEQFNVSLNELFSNLGKGFETLINKIEELIVGQNMLIDLQKQRLEGMDQSDALRLESQIEGERQVGGGAGATDQPESLAERLKGVDMGGGLLSLLATGALGAIGAKALMDYLKKENPALAKDVEDMADKFQSTIALFFKSVRDGIRGFFMFIPNQLKKLRAFFTKKPDFMKNPLGKEAKNIPEKIQDFFQGLRKTFKPATDILKILTGPAFKLIGGLARRIFAPVFAVIDAVKGFTKGQEDFDSGSKLVDGLLGSVREIFDGFLFKPLDLIKDLVLGKFVGLFSKSGEEAIKNFSFSKIFRNLFDFIVKLFTEKIPNTIKKAFGVETRTPEQIQQDAIADVMSKKGQKKIKLEEAKKLGFTTGNRQNLRIKNLTPEQQEQLSQSTAKATGEKISKITQQPFNEEQLKNQVLPGDLSQNQIMDNKPNVGEVLTEASDKIKTPTNVIIQDNSDKSVKYTEGSKTVSMSNKTTTGAITVKDETQSALASYGMS